MEASGLIDIGNHTCSHLDCRTVSEKKLISDVTRAERDIEVNLGKRKVASFAYPAYSATNKATSVLSKLGFKIHLTGLNRIVKKASNLTNIKRFLMSNDYSGQSLLNLIKWWERR